MKLSKLIEFQSSGAMKTQYDKVTGVIKLGGTPVSEEQCKNIVTMLGWERYDAKPWEIIEKTNKFIRGIKSVLVDEAIVDTDVTFRNFRRTNTERYYDRIKMISPDYDITIMYGMPGLGGAYAIFDSSDGFRQPQYSCRSIKQVAEYINSMYTDDDNSDEVVSVAVEGTSET